MVLHFDVAFAVDVVLDVTKGWRNVWLNPKVFPLFVSFGIECFDTLPRVMKKPAESLVMTRDRFSIRWSVESAGV